MAQNTSPANRPQKATGLTKAEVGKVEVTSVTRVLSFPGKAVPPPARKEGRKKRASKALAKAGSTRMAKTPFGLMCQDRDQGGRGSFRLLQMAGRVHHMVY